MAKAGNKGCITDEYLFVVIFDLTENSLEGCRVSDKFLWFICG